jgi:hypothetical protein
MTETPPNHVLPEKPLGDADSGALEVEESTATPLDPAEERDVVRKLDRVIMPLMAFVYFFQC